MKALMYLDSWGGRSRHRVEIEKKTPKRYKVRLLEDCMKGKAGAILYVPHYAIRIIGVNE